jgi:Fe2+ transport system protein B
MPSPVVLIGNANVGKSAVFGALTGAGALLRVLLAAFPRVLG